MQHIQGISRHQLQMSSLEKKITYDNLGDSKIQVPIKLIVRVRVLMPKSEGKHTKKPMNTLHKKRGNYILF